MSHLFWLDQEHLNRIKHMFPKPREVARTDDQKVLSGIIHVIRNRLYWRDSPSDYGPHKSFTTDGLDGPRWPSLCFYDTLQRLGFRLILTALRGEVLP